MPCRRRSRSPSGPRRSRSPGGCCTTSTPSTTTRPRARPPWPRGSSSSWPTAAPRCCSPADAEGVAVLRFRPSLWSLVDECYLAELYVVPGRRGGGLGPGAAAGLRRPGHRAAVRPHRPRHERGRRRRPAPLRVRGLPAHRGRGRPADLPLRARALSRRRSSAEVASSASPSDQAPRMPRPSRGRSHPVAPAGSPHESLRDPQGGAAGHPGWVMTAAPPSRRSGRSGARGCRGAGGEGGGRRMSGPRPRRRPSRRAGGLRAVRPRRSRCSAATSAAGWPRTSSPGWCCPPCSCRRAWPTPSWPGCRRSPASTPRSSACSATRSSARRASSCSARTPRSGR